VSGLEEVTSYFRRAIGLNSLEILCHAQVQLLALTSKQ